jgi:preprotein translocase subunit SecD
VLSATFGLQFLGRGLFMTILGATFIVISTISYYLAKKERILL